MVVTHLRVEPIALPACVIGVPPKALQKVVCGQLGKQAIRREESIGQSFVS
jgi:hypothetical protein